jgi:HD-GYP domain-containing protein (c-di-GMP phosphodiesterase class II)
VVLMVSTTYRERLAATLEARYFGMAGHVDRMSRFVEAIARRLGVDAAQAQVLRGAARLHDMGKLAIPDRILLKPGRLTLAERLIVEQHPVLGYELLRNSGADLLDVAASIALSHHERWDGTGYPDALGGDDIPLGARIIFVADAYDAMTSDRVYRGRLSDDEAIAELARCSGTQFDPDVVAALADELGIADAAWAATAVPA